MELFSSNIKKFLVFSFISGNGTFQPKPKKQKNPPRKKFLIFREMIELSDSKIEKFLIFPEMECCTFSY